MSVALLKSRPDPGLWTSDQFLDFYMSRPEGERWQLIDGLAMMMVSPTKVHQRIGRNLLNRLDEALERQGTELLAYYDFAIRIPGVDGFSPEPDVVVVDGAADYRHYADRFYLVAEVISPSNTAELIERKLELYRSHPDNLYCLTVSQDSVEVKL